MTQHGTLPTTVGPCRCESPMLDRLGTIFLDNVATWRVRYCQRCGGAYDAQHDGAPLPGETVIRVWECEQCAAANLDHLGRSRCSNCGGWRCVHCDHMNKPDLRYCERCKVLRLTHTGNV